MPRTTAGIFSISIAVVALAGACSGGEQAESAFVDDVTEDVKELDEPIFDDESPVIGQESLVGAAGTITVTVDDTVLQISADGSGGAFDLSAALDELDPGRDQWVVTSADGQWLALDTERFGCEDWSCLVVVDSDLTAATVVMVDGELVHPQEWGAISNDGNVLVLTSDIGANDLDLVVLHRTGDAWSSPVPITATSPHSFNERGRLTRDESAVLFDCGPTQYGLEGTGVCRVSLDGSNFERIVAPEDGPGGGSSNAARSGSESPDGSVVFEADWGENERLWRLLPDGSLSLLSGLGNDNSPCVLPDGSVASLWLQRDGNNAGLHELKVEAPGSTDYQMLLTNVDVTDIGVHCAG